MYVETGTLMVMYTHVYQTFMGPLGMRLTFKLEILPVVMFQRCFDCDRSKSVMKQAVIRLKDWGEIPPSALLQVKRKEGCTVSFLLAKKHFFLLSHRT